MNQATRHMTPDAWLGVPLQLAIRDLVAIHHPVQPWIAYHLFWGDDIDFPEDNDPADHEIVWVAYDPATGRGALAVELVTPAIASPGLPESFAPTIAERLAENRHLKWVEVSRRGFIVLDVDRSRVHGTFHHLDDAHLILPDPTDLTVAAEVEVRRGTPRLIKL